MVGEQLQRRLQVAPRDFQRTAHQRARALRLLLVVPRERRRKAGLHLLAQLLLELRVAAKPELCDEARHCRRADPRPLGEPGDTLQTGDGIAGQQHARELALGEAQVRLPLAHELADPRAGVICYIRCHLFPSWHILDKHPIRW